MAEHNVAQTRCHCLLLHSPAAARCLPAAAGARMRRGGRAGSACALRPSNAARDPVGLGAARRRCRHADRRPRSAHRGLGARAHADLRLATQCRGLERRSADRLSPRALRHDPRHAERRRLRRVADQQSEGHAGRRGGRQCDRCSHALAQDRSRPDAAERRRTTRAFRPATLRLPPSTRGSLPATCARSTCRPARAARSTSACMR